MYLTGDYVEPSESFNTEFCGPCTEIFMEYISNDLAEKHWDGIFRALAAVLKHVTELTNLLGAPRKAGELRKTRGR